MAEQPTATSDGGLQALRLENKALSIENKKQKETIQELRVERNLFTEGFTPAAEAGSLQEGPWIRQLYEVALRRNVANWAIAGEVFRHFIEALGRLPVDDEKGQRTAVLHALVEYQGIAGLKVAITALVADNPSRDSILLLVEDAADANVLKKVLHNGESKATPDQLNSAISSLAKAARTHGGKVAMHADGVLTLAEVINGPGGLSGEIHRIAALVVGGGHVPERIPAPAGTSRPAAGGLQQPGPAGARRAAAAPTSQGEGSSAAAAAPAPAETSRLAAGGLQQLGLAGAPRAAVASTSGAQGSSTATAALMPTTQLAPSQDQAPAAIAGTGPGQHGVLVLQGEVADGDDHGGGEVGEPVEPYPLTADFLVKLISHFKSFKTFKQMTLKRSKFIVQVRYGQYKYTWSYRIVPPTKQGGKGNLSDIDLQALPAPIDSDEYLAFLEHIRTCVALASKRN